VKSKALELFGYERATPEQLRHLSEVTFAIDAEQARDLGAFFLRCAAAIEGRPSWEHEHFSPNDSVQIVVYNSSHIKRDS